MPPSLSAFIAVLHFSHSRVFNNEINSYPKISVKRSLAYNWRVLSTVEGYCLQLRGTVYSWGVLSTVEVYCLQLRGTVYSWGVLSTVEGYCLQLRGTVYSWGVLFTSGHLCRLLSSLCQTSHYDVTNTDKNNHRALIR
jgi:hypothetical protein